jgi:hypothetical protein
MRFGVFEGYFPVFGVPTTAVQGFSVPLRHRRPSHLFQRGRYEE